jgi:hypothetical protein
MMLVGPHNLPKLGFHQAMTNVCIHDVPLLRQLFQQAFHTGLICKQLRMTAGAASHSSSLPSYLSTPVPDTAMRQCMELEREQQWLELADYLIKHFALRRRLPADSMPA